MTPNQLSREIGRERSQWAYDVLNPNKKVGISKNIVDLICNRFPQVNRNYLLTGEGDIGIKPFGEDNKDSYQVKETRPRVPLTVQAGMLTEAMDGTREYECEQLPVINAFPRYDFTIIVKGDSMEPKYEGGDEIACKRIDDTSFIQWGRPHVLDTAQGLVLKRIYDDGKNIRCVSYNRDYPDFSIDKKEIYSISLVVGLVRI